MLDILLNKAEEDNLKKGSSEFNASADKPIKSMIKSFSWRIVGTLDTMLISYLITGKMSLAVSIGGIEVVTKTILYYFHERLWANIHRIKLYINKKSDEKRVGYHKFSHITTGKINSRILRDTNVTLS